MRWFVKPRQTKVERGQEDSSEIYSGVLKTKNSGLTEKVIVHKSNGSKIMNKHRMEFSRWFLTTLGVIFFAYNRMDKAEIV